MLGRERLMVEHPEVELSSRRIDTVLGLLVAALSLGLYRATVAPTVLWGDGGHLQLNALLGHVQGSAGSHPLWVWIAHGFAVVLDGDAAGCVNLVSAVFGALTVGLLYGFVREFGITRFASLLTALSFAVSHTFWQHSVRAEVYTLLLAFMVGLGWLGLRWFHAGRQRYLVAAGFVLGLGIGAHLMIGLFVPGLAWLALRRRPRWTEILSTLAASLLGLAPWGFLIARDAVMRNLGGMELVRWALFSFEGYDFGGAMFDFRLGLLADDAFQWLFFLGLQFVGLAGVAGLLGFLRMWRRGSQDSAVYVALLYLGTVAFAFAFRVGDRYVFYLPSYIPFAVWIGFGLDHLVSAIRERVTRTTLRYAIYGVVILSLGLVPVSVYRIAPELVERGLTFRDTRHVPGPRGRYYFLWPPLRGYTDARDYAEQALAQSPPGALLLADPILSSPLRYLQVAEGIRPDVDVGYCCWGIEEVLARNADRPIVLADLDPGIYPVTRLREEYGIMSKEPVYLLVK
ncbi:MAG: glycosyltransferase family 117 protein [Anaerolineae bacterium]